MTWKRSPKRNRRGSKRLDMTDIRAVLRDSRTWSGLGVVAQPTDGNHWSFVGTDGEDGDIHVEVVLQPSGVPLTARLRAGYWEVPAVGDEVIVVIPDGAVDFQPIIVGLLSTGNAQNPSGQGPQPGRVVIIKGEVFVHDGAGGAVPLALKSELVAVDEKYAGHLHQLDSVTINDPTSGPYKALTPNPAAPPNYLPAAGIPLDPVEIVGTTVLLAK